MFGKGFEVVMTCVVILAVIGFIAVLYFGGTGIHWLIHHVRFE